MAITVLWGQIIIAVASMLVSALLAPKPKQRDQGNELQRQGVDNPLERVYGKRRVWMVVTDAMTSARMLSPDTLDELPNTIRSRITYRRETDSTSDSKKPTLLIEGPLCLSGRLNAPFQGSDPDDVNPQVNKKDYQDRSLRTDYLLSVGSFFELHLAGGVRHPLSGEYGLGADTNTFTRMVSATWGYELNIEKEFVYSGIPEASFDLTSNRLYDPLGSDSWNDPATWSGRPDHPVLQLLDFLLDEQGVGLNIRDLDPFSWLFVSTLGNVPTGTVRTVDTSIKAYHGRYGIPTFNTERKIFEPGFLLESNLTLNTEDPINRNIEQLLAACRGARLFKNRVGKWAIAPDWLHEDDLVQTITGKTGIGPFTMDWPTQSVRVSRNGTLLSDGTDYTITIKSTLSTKFAGGVQVEQKGTDPDSVIGITFVTALTSNDSVVMDYRLALADNPDGILGMTTQFHIVDDPATLGLDYDASEDGNDIDLIRISDHAKSAMASVSLDDRYNQCVVKFPDRETRFQQNQVVWPAEDSSQLSAMLAQDNGKSLITSVDINSITSTEKALDYAQWIVRSSRSADTVVYLLDIMALQLDPMDTVLISDRRLNIDAELWRCIKTEAQADGRVRAQFRRYEAEDFTYAVERFSESHSNVAHYPFGPVQNLAWSETLESDLEGSGTLSWDAQEGASSYVVSMSRLFVWIFFNIYEAGNRVYYKQNHYKARVDIQGISAAPDVNPDWEVIADDSKYWMRLSETAATSIITPAVTATRDYAYRVEPRSILRNIGAGGFIDARVTSATTDIAITNYFQPSPPTTGLNVGDLWFDSDDNNNQYRYNGTAWVDIRDSGIAAALASAGDAQATADGKVHTFAQESPPTDSDVPNYPDDVLGVGDVWLDNNDLNRIYRYNGRFWVDISDGRISAMITNYFQPSPPTAGLNAGDLWFDSNDDNNQYRYNGTAWVDVRDSGIARALANAGDAQATADGKVHTFAQINPPVNADVPNYPDVRLGRGDLWMDTNDNKRLYRYSGAAWVDLRDGTIASAQSSANRAQSTANSKSKVFRQTTAPLRSLSAARDIWIDTNDNDKMYQYTGVSWSEVTGDLAAMDSVGELEIDADSIGNAQLKSNCVDFDQMVKDALYSGDMRDIKDSTGPFPAGTILRWNGTLFERTKLKYSDLTGSSPGGASSFSGLSGTASVAQIPGLPTSKLTSGVLPLQRGGTGTTLATGTGKTVRSASPVFTGTARFSSLSASRAVTASDLTATDDCFVGDRLTHYGDTDTYFQFASNNIAIFAGGKAYLSMSAFGVGIGNSLSPTADNRYSCGTSRLRWKDVWAVDRTINTSDSRHKERVEEIDPLLAMQIVELLEWVNFKWKNYTQEAVYEDRQEPVREDVDEEEFYFEIVDGVAYQRSRTVSTSRIVYEEFPVHDEDGNPVMEEYLVKETDLAGLTAMVKKERQTYYRRKKMETKSVLVSDRSINAFVRTHSGVVAQQFKAVLATLKIDSEDMGALIYDPDADIYGVRYGELLPYVAAALKGLNTRVKKLEE